MMIDKKSKIKNLIKWIIIIGLLLFAFFKFKKTMLEAFSLVCDTPIYKVILCFVLGNLFFVSEGIIISKMTQVNNDKGLTVFQGISCTYMCAFYRLTTLGSGNGIAQVYYYNTKGIDASSGTGMAIVQYTFQKITIGIMGVLSFLVLVVIGNKNLLEYKWFMIFGVVVISFICLFLFLIAVSKKISGFVIWLARKIVKPNWKLYSKLETMTNAINALQTQGRITWKNKKLFLTVCILDVFKFFCWYMIPGVLLFDEYNVNPFMCMALMAVCNMIGCVMIAPSGIGTLEFTVTLLFSSIIADKPAIAATILIYRFFTWITPFLIGIIPCIFLKKDKNYTE